MLGRQSRSCRPYRRRRPSTPARTAETTGFWRRLMQAAPTALGASIAMDGPRGPSGPLRRVMRPFLPRPRRWLRILPLALSRASRPPRSTLHAPPSARSTATPAHSTPPRTMWFGVHSRACVARRPATAAAKRRRSLANDFAAILATACNRRKTGRGTESSRVAEARGRVDRAIAALLFQGGLRRSEAAALTWRDVESASERGVLVHIGRSKTDQEGTAADVR